MQLLIAYLLLLIAVSLAAYRPGFRNIFSTQRSLPWFIAGFSVFMINFDNINILSKMGIVAEHGYSGLWIFYTGVLGAGLLPIVFAPLWSRLKLMTDNQLILLRFSGRPAKILHLFRAIYVGYLVVALFIAQVFIGLSKLLIVFFDVTYTQSFLVITLLLAFIIAKNSLRLKVRTDLLNGIIYLTAFALGAWYVLQQYGGITEVYTRLNANHTAQVSLFPNKISQSTFETLPTLLVYFFVQWWSVNVLDGGAPEAQRFMNVKSPFAAFRAAFLPLILFFIVFLLHSFVIDTGILMLNDHPEQLPLINGRSDTEAGFITMYTSAMPKGLATLIFIAFLAGFISFLESFINWGSGFVVVDLFKTYVCKKRSDRFYTRLSYLIMALIGLSGILIAWYNTHLLGLQKFIFAMGAGVGPVFILRWFWWRVNAWSQFTAMLASLLYATAWDLLYLRSATFAGWINTQTELLNMSPFAFKLVCLTLLVTASWLLVTFLTKPDDPQTLAAFVKKVRPGGFWRGISSNTPVVNPLNILLVILYPIVSLLPFLYIWQFKFGAPWLAAGMVTLWIALLWFTVQQMGRKPGKTDS
jgi:solute:Na+ symporter, SSS family